MKKLASVSETTFTGWIADKQFPVNSSLAFQSSKLKLAFRSNFLYETNIDFIQCFRVLFRRKKARQKILRSCWNAVMLSVNHVSREFRSMCPGTRHSFGEAYPANSYVAENSNVQRARWIKHFSISVSSSSKRETAHTALFAQVIEPKYMKIIVNVCLPPSSTSSSSASVRLATCLGGLCVL